MIIIISHLIQVSGVIIVVLYVSGSGSLEEMVPQRESTYLLTHTHTPYLLEYLLTWLAWLRGRPAAPSVPMIGENRQLVTDGPVEFEK